MDLSHDTINAYVRNFVRHPHPILATLEADAAARGIPIIGPWEGQLLALMARSIQARHILELGMATGYSAIWLALATAEWEGQVTTIDQDATRVREAGSHFRDAGISDRVRIVHGTALSVLPEMAGPFDLIFNDILSYLQDTDEAHQLRQACVERLRPGGLLLCDNALRGGRVMAPSSEPTVQATQAFIEALLQDPLLDTSLLPIRDGILVCRKSSG